jgi:NADH:ubiquinone oxidoreductase subunit 6 (subunit J)
MTFGHAEMAQMMTESQSLITAIFVSTVCIGILLGLIIGLYRIVLEHRAADRSFKSEKSTKPVAAALTGTLVRPLKLIGTIILIAAGGGGYASHTQSRRILSRLIIINLSFHHWLLL